MLILCFWFDVIPLVVPIYPDGVGKFTTDKLCLIFFTFAISTLMTNWPFQKSIIMAPTRNRNGL